MKRWCRPFGFHTRSFTNRFVCNFLSSSAGFNLCSCFSRLTLFRSPSLPQVPFISLGLPFHTRAVLPFRFLTSAVFAPFRSLQFWILTTQPLRFLSLSSCLRPAVASSVRRPRFRSFGSPRSLPPGFPCARPRFRYSASLFVSFRSSPLRSHSRSTGAYLLLRFLASPSCRPFPFRSAHFRSLLFRF